MNKKTIYPAILCFFVALVPALSSCSTIFSLERKEYTFVFHSFTEPEINPLALSYSELLNYSFPEPQKEGHSFSGWYLDEGYTVKLNFNDIHLGKNDLYAKYDINQYELTVHIVEQTFIFDYNSDITINIDYGPSYLLKGYYFDKELTNEFTLKKMPAYNLEIYPLLSYVSRYYSLIFHTGVEEQFEKIEKEYRDLSNTLLPTPQKDYYEFDDWYLDEALTIKYDVDLLSEGDNHLYAKYIPTELSIEGKEIVYSTNMLDLEHFKKGKALTSKGELEDFHGGHTDFIPVKYGDCITFGNDYNISRYIRYIAAYDSKKRLLPEKGDDEGTTMFVVPHGVCYVVLSLYSNSLLPDSRISISDHLLPFEPYKKETLPIGEKLNRKIAFDKRYRPFSTGYSTETIDEASYKPLGNLKKPFFCLISDDGLKEEATYSIPMAISKGVPMTLGLMKYSEIWDERYLPVLKDAVNNHGFEVAQHGWTRYTDFTEDQLNYFFDVEKEYFESMGFSPKTAICPAHSINKLVSAVASQRFSVLRSGYVNHEEYQYGYGWYANGPKSNLYSLDCINISVEPLRDHKAHIDEACKNNWLMIGFYHENNLNETKRAQIESIIDYAKEKGMEFCTLKDVPLLSERN